MKDILLNLFVKTYRFFLNRRYNVTLSNIEILKSDKPILILPNHQAFIDPQILFSQIYEITKASPIVIDYVYNMPIIGHILRHINSIPVINFTQVKDRKKSLEKMHNNILERLKQGKNVVLYPSGQTQGQGYEVIFGKQSAHYLITNMPENTRVIGVRIRGLWGSVWSRAWSGTSVNLIFTFIRSIFYILANFVFFVPKRNVSLEFSDITILSKLKAKESIQSLNTFLESFYNINGIEKVTYIKHFFFMSKLKKKLPNSIIGSIKDNLSSNNYSNNPIKQSTIDFVYEKIFEIHENLNINSLNLDKSLAVDLRFDSIQLTELISIIKKKYKFTSTPDFRKLKTIRDVCTLAENKSLSENTMPECLFENISNNKIKRISIDNTSTNIRDLFLENFHKKNKIFTFDKIKGETTYKNFLLKSIISSLIIKKITKNDRIGIMLPALQSTSILVSATYLSGKTPVMFNWTVGEKSLTHCVNISGIKKILIAKSFFEKINDSIPNSLHNKFVFLEDEIAKLTIFTKLKGLFISKIPKLLKNISIPKTAVILFTSGSESMPKAVPLSHKNIIKDLYGTLSIFSVKSNDILLGILPPFHSFGFTATIILPLISNIRIAYSPDPTDSFSINTLINHCNITLLPTAPTFLKMILKNGKKNELSSIRIAMTGAEACTKDLIDLFNKKIPHGEILEGYGITECSPIVSITPNGKPKLKSVGKVIPTLQIYIENLDTKKKCLPIEEGMIYVSGDSIFNGYLDKNIKSPFKMINNKNYYKTGDLGYLDNDNYLFITGRLKRFVKIGGEMISLPMIESILIEKYKNEDEIVLAIESHEIDNKPIITCFSIKYLDINELNKHLQKSGVPNIVKITNVRIIKTIPTLGTGKTDYKALKNILNA